MDDKVNPQPLGSYTILRSLGKGGMGEVFLAHDDICKRDVAIKRIRDNLLSYASIKRRFLQEAHIAAKLTHPNIISIYSIHEDKDLVFYTMPYIEGETLKQILRTTKEQEKQGLPLHPIGGSIPSLLRIFLPVCQAIAYAHSKKILHRDLKPENIIIGKFGEVLILDWGLADYIDNQTSEENENIPQEGEDLTKPGKIVGTISYMPPERVLGSPADIYCDIYSLGVILYQILTLRLPFHRVDLKTFRKTCLKEELVDPIEISPYRDIPPKLAAVVKKSLAPSQNDRYQSVSELIADLQNYIEGRADWLLTAHLDISHKEDWEFQENILLTKHIAITRSPDIMEWVSLMISKNSFPGNCKIETEIRLGSHSQGIGFLLNIPESSERKGLEEGYSLWIGSKSHPESKLFCNNIEVMQLTDLHLLPNTWVAIRIEKMENNLRFYVNGTLSCNYVSHVPLSGTHIGLLYRDADFEIKKIAVFSGSQNLTVNCLAVPDAFLAYKAYHKALSEYRRISYCFAGRVEGREALFRAGITLIEQGASQKKKSLRSQFFLAALEEFGKLRHTPGAPLEYLGKSLVYKADQELEEEVKCLELAIRKYPSNPLSPQLADHIVFRLHESSAKDRKATYHLALLCLRQLPNVFAQESHRPLLQSLETHIEKPSFLKNLPKENTSLSILLAFWLGKPITLVEIIEQLSAQPKENSLLIMSALFALLHLGYAQWASENSQVLQDNVEVHPLLQIALTCHEKKISQSLEKFFLLPSKPFTFLHFQTFTYVVETAIAMHKSKEVLPFFAKLPKEIPTEERMYIDALHIYCLLLQDDSKQCESIFQNYPKETIEKENSPLRSLYGCYLAKTTGEKKALQFLTTTSQKLYPPSSNLLSYSLSGHLNSNHRWDKEAFFWEKKELYRQLFVYFHCLKEEKEEKKIQAHLQKWKKAPLDT